MKKQTVIIIGTGLAGYMLAKEFRKLDCLSALVLFTLDEGAFYSKPLLSTSLTAKREVSKIATFDAASMASQLNATIHVATKITRVDIESKHVEWPDNRLSYDKLVIATGSTVISPPLLGNAVGEILSVNNLEDYSRFCEVIAGKKKIAILGAGLVGCEFANDLINTGHEVHVIDPAYYPLQRFLPEKIGRLLENNFKERGVQWHFGQLACEINKSEKGYRLTLSDQASLEVDVVMSAIGLNPNIELAKSAGLKTNYGIWVDANLQTSSPDIYALGDCAEVAGQVLFFVAPLLQCVDALAKTLTGDPTPVVYSVMSATLKTPSCPIVIAAPPRNLLGEWQIEGEGNDLRALYYDQMQHLCGFALTGKKIIEKNQLMKVMVV